MAARVCAERAAVLLLAAALLAGCGQQAQRIPERHVSRLCVDAGLPLSGRDGTAARAFLAGLRMQLPPAGLTIGGYPVRLCHVFDDGAGAGAELSAAARAASSANTIAYVGELSGTAAEVSDAAVAQAGIAMLTPSAPAPEPTSARRAGAPPEPSRHTELYLLPSAQTQSEAVTDVRIAHGCGRKRRRGHPACAVSGAATAPLCTGLSATGSGARQRFCVVAGPDLASWTSPAVAYGDSAGLLLVRSLQAVAAGGGDVSSRATVLQRLLDAKLAQSPIGPIRFDAHGAIDADQFTAYTVRSDGKLVLSKSFHTH